MGITYIPGPEATLGPALAEIATAIGNIAKPNAQFQRAFQQALATKPELMQQLADLEGRTPGVISKQFAPLIGEELAGVISRMIPSLDVQKENIVSQNLPGVANVSTEMLGDVAQTPGQIAAVRSLTGARPDELTVEREQAGQAGEAGRQRAAAAAWWARQSDADKKAMVGPYGTLDDVIATPSFLQRLALDYNMARSRRADDIHNYMMQRQIANATWWQQKTGVGTIDDWLFYFSDKGRRRLEGIQQGGAATPDDARLMQIGAAFDAAPAQLRYAMVNAAVDNVRQLLPAIGKASGTNRVALIAALNETLANIGSDMTAQWTDAKTKGGSSSLLRFEKLRFFDRQGNEISSDDAIGRLTASASSGASRGRSGQDLTHARQRAQYWQAEGQKQGLQGEPLNNFIKAKLRSEGIDVQ